MCQNFRPGVAERMGIDYDDMKAINDKIIYVSISGFGATGPYSQKRVYDPGKSLLQSFDENTSS